MEQWFHGLRLCVKNKELVGTEGFRGVEMGLSLILCAIKEVGWGMRGMRISEIIQNDRMEC